MVSTLRHSWWTQLERLPFTPSIRVENLGVNIQCCSFSKRKMVRSENVLVSIGKFKRKRKNALIKSIAYNFWNVSNGMVCTISFSNQSFRVFRVNGKRPWCPQLVDKTKDFSWVPFIRRPSAIVHCSIVFCVARDWLQTTYKALGDPQAKMSKK